MMKLIFVGALVVCALAGPLDPSNFPGGGSRPDTPSTNTKQPGYVLGQQKGTSDTQHKQHKRDSTSIERDDVSDGYDIPSVVPNEGSIELDQSSRIVFKRDTAKKQPPVPPPKQKSRQARDLSKPQPPPPSAPKTGKDAPKHLEKREVPKTGVPETPQQHGYKASNTPTLPDKNAEHKSNSPEHKVHTRDTATKKDSSHSHSSGAAKSSGSNAKKSPPPASTDKKH